MHFHALPPARRSSQANPCTSSWIRAIPSFHLPCNPFPLLSLGTNISQHIHSLALTLDLCSLEAKSWGCFSLGARAAYEQSWTWLHLQRMNSKTWHTRICYYEKLIIAEVVWVFDAVAAHPHSFSILCGIPVVMPLICRGIGSIMFTMPPHWQNISLKIVIGGRFNFSFNSSITNFECIPSQNATSLGCWCLKQSACSEEIPFMVLSSPPRRPILSFATVKCCTLILGYL